MTQGIPLPVQKDLQGKGEDSEADSRRACQDVGISRNCGSSGGTENGIEFKSRPEPR
jgi:hypothetical protein